MNFTVNILKKTIDKVNDDECIYTNSTINIGKDDVDFSIVEDILKNDYIYIYDMQAVNCLLNNVLRSHLVDTYSKYIITSKNINRILSRNKPSLTQTVNNDIKNIRLLSDETVSSEVYLADLYVNDVKFIIKVPNSEQKLVILDLIKEYIIGKATLNRLRRITPSFMYTFSMINCALFPDNNNKMCVDMSGNSPISIFERINGVSMKSYIRSGVSFEEWLKVFVQILLNLDISQRLYRFNHNDLHSENIMVRRHNTPVTYHINSETSTYTVRSNVIPVFIDFGYSSAYVYDTYLEGAEIDQAFPTHFVTCYDMYLHLVRCVYEFRYNHDEQQKVFSLFKFFRNKDIPYTLYSTQYNIMSDDFFHDMNINTSIMFTPGDFLDWIIQNNKGILDDTIQINKRKTFINLGPDKSKLYDNLYTTKYDKIIRTKTKQSQITTVIEKFNSCTQDQNYKSFIMTVQTVNILKNMFHDNTNDEIRKIIEQFNKIVTDKERKNNLIYVDMIRLNKVFTDPMFDFIKDDGFEQDYLEYILEKLLRINDITDPEIICLIELIDDKSLYDREFKLYYNLYLTILELNLTSDYKEWINKFTTMKMYNYYVRYSDKIERFKRFKETYSKTDIEEL